MELEEAIRDADNRVKNTGFDWHVVKVFDEIRGYYYETVSEHYLKVHKKAKSLHVVKAPGTPYQKRRRFLKYLKSVHKKMKKARNRS